MAKEHSHELDLLEKSYEQFTNLQSKIVQVDQEIKEFAAKSDELDESMRGVKREI